MLGGGDGGGLGFGQDPQVQTILYEKSKKWDSFYAVSLASSVEIRIFLVDKCK